MNIKIYIKSLLNKDVNNKCETKFIFTLGKVSIDTLGMPGWSFEVKRRAQPKNNKK